MSRNVRKRTFVHVHPAMIQISLRIRAVWSESSLSADLIAKDAKFLHADNEDSNQTARMRSLIWVFVGCTSEGTFSHVVSHIDYFPNVFCHYPFVKRARPLENTPVLLGNHW